MNAALVAVAAFTRPVHTKGHCAGWRLPGMKEVGKMVMGAVMKTDTRW